MPCCSLFLSSLACTLISFNTALTRPSFPSDPCPGATQGARRSQYTAAEEELLVADARSLPSKHESTQKLPRASAIDLHHLHHPQATLGEPPTTVAVAGTAAPPKCGRRRCD